MNTAANKKAIVFANLPGVFFIAFSSMIANWNLPQPSGACLVLLWQTIITSIQDFFLESPTRFTKPLDLIKPGRRRAAATRLSFTYRADKLGDYSGSVGTWRSPNEASPVIVGGISPGTKITPTGPKILL
jgi:hypothetical protein